MTCAGDQTCHSLWSDPAGGRGARRLQSSSVASACLPVVGVVIALSAVVIAWTAVRVRLIMRRDVVSAAGCMALNIVIGGV